MKTKLAKGVAIILLVSLVSFIPLDFKGVLSILSASDEDNWVDPESYIFIKENTTWHKEDDLTFNKAVAIIDGATLTIEKGAKVQLGPDPDFLNYGSLTVSHGKIIAQGTEAEPIIFTGIDNKGFSLDYWEYSESYMSLLRYVEFRGGGKSWGGGGPIGLKKQSIFSTALAESGIPAIYFSGGKLRIENSRFVDGQYADIEVDMEVGEEENLHSFIQVVNSNFEKSRAETAVSSNIYCPYAAPSLCNNRVRLKNNWYGSSDGPNSEDGKKVEWNEAGSLVLEGFRAKELIADPAILIPGIMGSKEKDGEWIMDPILHTYDDITRSMEDNGFERGKNFFGFPYDWRKENEITAEKLKTAINTIKQETGSLKVDLVAHSMGGLVARSYIEGENYGQDVDQLITLGTPHKGAPESYLKWEAGEGFLKWQGKATRWYFNNEAEHNGYDNVYDYIRSEIKSVKQLLPEYNYLYNVHTDNEMEYPSGYPRNEFLENLNEQVNLVKLEEIRFVNVSGKVDKHDSTINRIRVVNSDKEGLWEHGMPEGYYDFISDKGLEYGEGDETVPFSSAQGVPSDKHFEIESTHGKLPTEAQCVVVSELSGRSECNHINNIDVINIFQLFVHSPIDVQVVDSQGRRVGKDFETGKDLQEIPGSFYSGSNTQAEFLTIPNPQNGEYRILTQGTGEGEYRIEAVTVKEDEKGEVEEAVFNLSGIAQEGKVVEEKPIEIAEGVIVVEEKDELAPEITVESPESKEYANNKLLNINYSITDNVSSQDKIKSNVYLDEVMLLSNQIDLSLEKIGSHVLRVVAEDEAQNESQKEVNFTLVTNLKAIQDNVKHYRKIKLIKNKQEEKFLLIHLEGIEMMDELIAAAEKMRLPEKMKRHLINNLKKVRENKIEFLIDYLSNAKRLKRGIDPKAGELLIESLNFIR